MSQVYLKFLFLADFNKQDRYGLNIISSTAAVTNSRTVKSSDRLQLKHWKDEEIWWIMVKREKIKYFIHFRDVVKYSKLKVPLLAASGV